MFGARPVKRAVQTYLETPIAQAILRGEVGEDDVVVVDVDAAGCAALARAVAGAAACG